MPMKPTTLLCRAAAIAVLIFASGLTVYRASTQAIAHDEALAWESYIDGGIYHLLAFDTNNHVLFTAPAKLCTKLFGLREITLRIPSVFGAFAYLVLIYVLARKLFDDGILLPISVAVLALNPLVLDFMPAARGYILGLACVVAAMYSMVRTVDLAPFTQDDKHWRSCCALISVFLALSVVANLSNVFAAAGLTLSFLAAVLFQSAIPANRQDLKSLTRYLVMPGITVGLFIMWPYLIQLRPAQFNISLSRGSDALRDAFASSFLYKWTDDVYSSILGAVPPVPGSWQSKTLELGFCFLLPLLFCFLLVGLLLVYHPRDATREISRTYCRIFSGAPVACVLLTIILHALLRVNYPYSRYCLYLIPLGTIGVLCVARLVAQRVPNRALQAVGLMVAAAVITDYLFSLNTQYFRYNAYDVISRDLYQTISNDARSQGLETVRVGGTWWYEPELNFYRQRYNARWMAPYDVRDRSYFWQAPNSLPPADYDYFVFTPASDPLLTGPNVRMIYHNPQFGVSVIRNLK